MTRQNCFGNWIKHCHYLRYSYLSRQWRHARRHWEIPDEEGTLLKSICQKWHFTRAAVPFEIPILEKADGERQSFLEWKNWCLFHWSAENKSWPELLHWSVEDFLTDSMLSTLSEQWKDSQCNARQCCVTPRKSDATVSTTEHSTADCRYKAEWRRDSAHSALCRQSSHLHGSLYSMSKIFKMLALQQSAEKWTF